MNEPFLDFPIQSVSVLKRRKALLPFWVKFFVWFYLVCGVLIFAIVLGRFFGLILPISIYGIEYGHIFSLAGFSVIGIFLIKFLVALGMWFGKKWAIGLTIFDAILGVLVCLGTMIYQAYRLEQFGDGRYMFRFELVILVVYGFKMLMIKNDWDNTT